MTFLYYVTCKNMLARSLKPEWAQVCLQFMKMDMTSRKQWIVSNQHVSEDSVVIEDLRIFMELPREVQTSFSSSGSKMPENSYAS